MGYDLVELATRVVESGLSVTERVDAEGGGIGKTSVYRALRKSRIRDFLRHCYATTCINELVGRGLQGLRDLVWMSKAMGHSSVDVTIRSYYNAVPALAALLQERSWKSFDDLVPGVM